MRKILSLCAAFLFAAGMMADPVVLPATLDVNNVSFRSEGMPDFVPPVESGFTGTYFDMGAHDSANDTLLYAEWDVTIQPLKYDLAVDVYNTNSWRVQIYLLSQTGDTLKSLRYKGSSGQCGNFAIGSIDMSDLAAGNYKLRAHAATAWSAMKLKDIIVKADYKGVNVDLPGELLPDYALLSDNASVTDNAIAFKPSTANTDWAKWNVSFAAAGTYNVSIDITASNGHNYGVALLSADGTTEIAAVNEGGQTSATGVRELGAITVATAGNYVIKLTNAVQWSEAVLNKIVIAAPLSPVPTEAAPVPTWPAAQVVSLYSDSYTFAPATLNSYNEGWWDNPTLTEETISENKYLHYNGRMTGMIGWQFGNIPVTIMEYIHVDIWPSANTKLKMGPTSADPTVVASYELTVEAGKWNSIDIPLADLLAAYPTFDLANIFQNQFTEYSALTDLSIDNVYFYRTTPYVDPTKPTDFTAVLAGNSYFSVTIKANAKDDSGAVLFDVINGELTVATGSAASGVDANIVVKDLAPNTEYNLKVIAKDATGNATDPIVVVAATKEAPAPAAAPTYAADKVFAIFADGYTNNLGQIQDWYAGPAIAEGALSATSKTLCVEPNATENSCFGLAFAPTDVTSYDAMELDIYATKAGVLTVSVIGVTPDPAPTYNLVANQWNHIVLNIAGNTKTDCEQIGFYSCDKLAGTCFIQNVLFVEYVQVKTCADVYSMAKNDAVALNDVTVTYANGKNVWVRDATGSMLLYLTANSTWKAGDVLSGVAGTVDIYNDLYEVKPSAEQAAAVTVTAGEAPAPEELTAVATTDMNKYVILKGITTAADAAFAEGTASNITFKIGEADIVIRNNFKNGYSFTGGQKYDVVGVVTIYSKKPQIYFISAEPSQETAINNPVVSEKAVKMIENGQLIIMKNGVKYNAQGAELR